jgi:putative membrane protein
MLTETDLHQLVLSVIYSGVGVVVFALAFLLIVKLAPFSVRKEIEEDQNTSLGIIIGSVLIGLAIIISAAIT